MRIATRSIAITLVAFFLSACAAPTGRKIAQESAAAMGGAEKLQAIKTITMKGGTGTRLRLGQMRKATDEEAPGTLSDVIEFT